MVIGIKLNDGHEILAESLKPQTLMLLIKNPKTFSPKHFASNNPLERHYNPHINLKYSMDNQCTCNSICCLSQLISIITIKCDLCTIIDQKNQA